MNIRRLKKSDAQQFRELRLEFVEKYPVSFGMGIMDENSQPLDFFENRIVTNFLLGAFEGDEIFGVIAFSQGKSSKEKHKGCIWSFGVKASSQGQGVGRRLLYYMLAEIKRSFVDVERVTLKVEATNHPAYNLYASMGFQEFGLEKKAVKIGDEYYDEIYMEKIL